VGKWSTYRRRSAPVALAGAAPPVPEIVWDWEGSDPDFVLLRLTTKTYASVVKLTEAAEVTLADFWVKRIGTGSGLVRAKIWADAGNLPGDLLATSDAVDSSTLSTDADWVRWTFAGVNFAAGTQYWVGLQSEGGGVSDYLGAERRLGPAEVWYVLRFGENPPPWSASSKSRRLTTRLLGFPS
jgi:hypothetical protein